MPKKTNDLIGINAFLEEHPDDALVVYDTSTNKYAVLQCDKTGVWRRSPFFGWCYSVSQYFPLPSIVGEDLRLRDAQVCHFNNLDNDLRYLGTASGVVDLQTANLLPKEEGKKHKVTFSSETCYKPDAKHPFVDGLIVHWEQQMRALWWRCVGQALRGVGSPQFYVLWGDFYSGKTTLGYALSGALRYHDLNDSSLIHGPSNFYTGTWNQAFVPPSRIVVVDDYQYVRITPGMFRSLSEDGNTTYRLRREKQPRTRRTSASLFLFVDRSSTKAKEKMRRLHNNPVVSPRMTVIDGPYLPFRDSPYFTNQEMNYASFVREDAAFREAFLARMISAASKVAL